MVFHYYEDVKPGWFVQGSSCIYFFFFHVTPLIYKRVLKLSLLSHSLGSRVETELAFSFLSATPLGCKGCIHILHIATAHFLQQAGRKLLHDQAFQQSSHLSQPQVPPFHLQIFNDPYRGEQSCCLKQRVHLGNYWSQIPWEKPSDEKGALLAVLRVTGSRFVALCGSIGISIWMGWIVSLKASARRAWTCREGEGKNSTWNRNQFMYLFWGFCQKSGIQDQTKGIPCAIT